MLDQDNLFSSQMPILNQWVPDQALPPMRIQELSEKTDALVCEYKSQKQRNKYLKEEIEKLEKLRNILINPESFETEMNKLKLSINCMNNAIRSLEENAKNTAKYLKNVEKM